MMLHERFETDFNQAIQQLKFDNLEHINFSQFNNIFLVLGFITEKDNHQEDINELFNRGADEQSKTTVLYAKNIMRCIQNFHH
jgi:hypothetical protein